jgi:hypothetical protein
VDRLVGVVESDVHVDPEDDLLARHELQPGDQLPVARPGDDALVLPERERVGAGRADREPALVGGLLHQPPQRAQLVAGLARVAAGLGGDLADRLHQLGLDLAVLLDIVEHLEQALDRTGQVERVPIDDHELFLDADRERGAREPVLHDAIVSG